MNESNAIARKTAIAALEIQIILDDRSAEVSREERPLRVRIAVELIATYISASWGIVADLFLGMTSSFVELQLVVIKRFRR